MDLTAASALLYATGDAAVAPWVCCLLAEVIMKRRGRLSLAHALDRAGAWVFLAAMLAFMAAGILAHHWFGAAMNGTAMAVTAWYLWRGRKRRGRNLAAKLLGAKSRAIRAALVRTMRERSQPRPVLRPVPVPR